MYLSRGRKAQFTKKALGLPQISKVTVLGNTIESIRNKEPQFTNNKSVLLIMSDQDQNPPLKRQKIKKACDNCRSRKIKCDGEQPCVKCRNSGANCLYTHVEKKRQVTKKDDKSSTIQSLDQRMNKMESLITTLIEKLNTPDGSSSYKDSTDGAQSSINLSASSTDINSPQNTEVQSQVLPSTSPVPPADDIGTAGLTTKSVNKFEDKYIGSQSSLSVLSPRGLMWLAKKANDPTIISQFKTIVTKSHGVFYNYMKKWIEPIDKSQVCQLPPRETMDQLMKVYEKDLLQFSFFMPLDEVRTMIDTYYGIQEKTTHKRLSNSEFLILHCVAAISANLLAEEHAGDLTTLRTLKKIEDDNVNTAIHYYHRIAIIGEGIKSVQGILLLFSHTNFSLLPQANFTLISTAIRHSQGIGLHRKEALLGLPEEEKRKKRKVWWWAYLADRTDCLKAGKPLSIGDFDVSVMDLEEFRDLIFEGYSEELLNNIFSGEVDLMDPKAKGLTNLKEPSLPFDINAVISYFITCFYKNTGEAYEKLFSATALIGKNADQIMETIETLNLKLEAWNENVPISIRPGAPLRLGVYNDLVDDKLLMLHFTYYLHVMIINRMAFKRSWLNHDQETVDDNSTILPRQRKSIIKCLEAARTILRIVQQMNACKSSNFNIPLFVFTSAFFTLLTACLEFPTANESKNDLILIQHTIKVLFTKLQIMSNQLGDDKIYNIMAHSTKFFLRIGILVYNNANVDKIDSSALDEELRQYQKLLEESTSSHKRRRSGNLKPSSQFSPPQPSSLSHMRSTNTEQGVPQYGPSIPSSQANTPNLNNILNDPLSHATGQPYDGVSNPASVGSVSSTDGFDPFNLSEIDIAANNNVFKQLFPMPNLYFNGTDQGNDSLPVHFEW